MVSWKDKRQEAGEKLAQRTQESYDQRDSSGRFGGLFKEEVEVPTWSASPAKHLIDVLPYINGHNHPNQRIKPGDISYVLIIFVHDNVGVNSRSFVCPARNYNKRCPICEQQKRLKEDGLEWDDPRVKDLEPKKKTIYNIICYDSEKEEDKGVQIWVTAWWNFERFITELASETPRGGGVIAFANPDKGKSISFKREGKGKTDTKYIGHAFVDRDYSIDNETLDQTYCLEEIIHIPTYDEIYQAFFAENAPDPDDSRGPKADKAVGGESDESVERLPSRRARRPQQEEEKPQPREEARQRREDPPRQREPEKPKEDVKDFGPDDCPHNHKFGQDIDRYQECQTCDNWDNCNTESEKILDEEKKRREEARAAKREPVKPEPSKLQEEVKLRKRNRS